MTLPSQFSLEEENVYKDIQHLVKNGSQSEKELSSFLRRYIDLLARTDFDDETFIINFTKAGLIIEASAKIYGTKVDRLWLNLEHVLESLKSKNQGHSKKKLDCEDGDELDADGDEEEGKRKLPHSRRKKKMGDALFSVDDFLEIDNFSGLLGKNMNESSNFKESKLKFCEKIPNVFIKNKRKTKKIDVCLSKCADDKEVIRLRDWIISEQGLLIKEIYTPRPESTFGSMNPLETDESKNGQYNEEAVDYDENCMFERVYEELNQESVVRTSKNLKGEKINDSKMVDLKTSLRVVRISGRISRLQEKSECVNALNVSKESDVAKFPNVLDGVLEDCLVDVDEVFWNSSNFQDVIPSKEMRLGKTNKNLCELCFDKKIHKKRRERCIEGRDLSSLDSYFSPHVQPAVSEPQFGILPDEELHSIFKTEMKLIKQLGKINPSKNINEAYHPEESPEELRNFIGFDGFEYCLRKRTIETHQDEMTEENLNLGLIEERNENYVEGPPPDSEFELPFPVTECTVRSSLLIRANDPGSKDDANLVHSELEYQKLVIEELKDHYAAKTSFAKNKELGLKISKWHEMIADKIKMSQKRGALNVKSLTEIIMSSFQSTSVSTKPTMFFKDLVQTRNRRDVPRYFFACLQLTNEGNLDIYKSDSQPLTTDCMIITQLSSSRIIYELDECTIKSPRKEMNSSEKLALIKRKRNSEARSPSILESKSLSKNKKIKQNDVNSHKRTKNFKSDNNSSKRRRCSTSSTDSSISD